MIYITESQIPAETAALEVHASSTPLDCRGSIPEVWNDLWNDLLVQLGNPDLSCAIRHL